MNYSKTIYKIDSKGKSRFLHVYAEGAWLVQESGQVGTTNAVIHRSECKPKNVGKANETTAEEQAIAEATSKIETKMTTGYFETLEEAKNTNVILPMLAKDYNKERNKVIFPCFIQPKLDGMRALYVDNKLITRKGKEIATMDHICEDLRIGNKNLVIDGELYIHGRTFQENMRLIKKYRGKESEEIKYYVYDLVEDKPFAIRYAKLKQIVMMNDTVEVVPTILCRSHDELMDHHKLFIGAGFEGSIVRHSDAGYGVNKRDSQLLKYKEFVDIACTIVNVEPSEKKPEQGQFVVEFDGKTFGCGMKFSHKEREAMLILKEQYIGQTAEIRFFELSEDGVPRFPVCHGIRLDK